MHLHKWIIFLTLSVSWKPLHSQILQEIKSKTGIYFNEMGIMFFYPTKWRVVIYVDLEPTLELWVQTKAHHMKIRNFCKKIKDKDWYSSTDCIAFDEYMKSKNKYIDNLKDLVVEHLVTRNQNPNQRRKRGVLNFIGEISKTMYGTQSDAKSYNENISELEKDQKEFVHLIREQLTVIKTTIGSINSTIQRVDQNERNLGNELNWFSNYSTYEIRELKEEISNVNLLNEQLKIDTTKCRRMSAFFQNIN
jgi:hypothetical protein